MKLRDVEVRHGRVDEMSATQHSRAGVTFAAAAIALNGGSWSLTHSLADHLAPGKISPAVRPLVFAGWDDPDGEATRGASAAVRALFLGGTDGPWVRGRLERLFYSGLVTDREELSEKTAFSARLVAVLLDNGALIAVPFECTDHYLRTGLIFTEEADPPPADLMDWIAWAFWDLLLCEPHDLGDYTAYLEHVGAGVWLEYGIACGQPFVEEHRGDPRRKGHPRRRRS
ncbi:MAG TPA: hypothetical protein VEL76_24820 [Gemmataceae bacterium]|nr:hypothetical protein [Gemmataceae bacterium]